MPAWRYGGPIHSVHGLCAALAARGHEVHVVTTNVDGPGETDVPLGTSVNIDGVRVHYFASRLLRRLYYSPGMRRFLPHAIAEAEIVHTHSVFLWPTTSAARIARRMRRPYVVSPRGMMVGELIARKNPFLKRAWIRMFEARNLAGACAVHVTSQLEKIELLRLGIKPQRVVEIPNGVDYNPGAAVSDEPPLDYILFLGRISWKKGLDRLVPAMALLPHVQLVVAGNDDEAYWPRMMALATRLGVSDRITYRGFVEGVEKDELTARAKLLVLPSHSENFGNVVLEAMSRGVPVVVTPEVGLASMVAQTRSGLVASGDPPELAAAIDSITSSPELRWELGRNAAAAARDLSWDRIAERMEREYSRIVCGEAT